METGLYGNSGDASGWPRFAAPICNTPSGLAVDAAGNVYFTDTLNGRVRKILPNGTISTIAGCGAATASCVPGVLGDGGPATVPWLVFPEDVVVDSTGNVYFSDGQRVRKVSPAGILSTVAGGGTDAAAQDVPAIRARLGKPRHRRGGPDSG